MWDEHAPNVITNITTAPKREDGIYLQIFAVKDGKRYEMKTVSLKDVTVTLTNGLLNDIEKLIEV